MPAPSLITEQGINVPKGWWDEAALDYNALLSANVTIDPVPGGRVVHLNDDGEFEMGLTPRGMGIILLNASNDFDVANPGMTPAGGFMHQAVAPTGMMSGLVCSGSYEVQSPEFDTANDYLPGDLLTAAADNTTEATGGVLTNAGSGGGGDVQQFVDPVCGVVAKGEFLNENGLALLDFWTVWLPGAYA